MGKKFVKIEKATKKVCGRISAPPSKSMAHRLLICAGLSNGKSRISGISYSEDVCATLDLLRGLGAECTCVGDTVEVTGCGGKLMIKSDSPLDCRECGSTLRFFIPICLTAKERVLLSGSPRLLERPLSIYEDICRDQKLVLICDKKEGHISLRGPLQSGTFNIKGDVSSQFISGLLFALPLCCEDSKINIIPPLESKPYIDLTLSALKDFGIEINSQDPFTYEIKGSQTYKPHDISVEGDYSNAAFFDAFNHLGGNIKVDGLTKDSLQGDKVYLDYFPLIENGCPTLNIGDCPDLAPILMALAAAHQGAVFTGTKRLRIKESDRGTAMACELKKFGISVDVEENTIKVHGGILKEPTEVLCSHNDHRIVMALSTLATITGGTIEGADAVRKSLPDYFDILGKIGIKVEFYDT